jgi:hypothetical protein
VRSVAAARSLCWLARYLKSSVFFEHAFIAYWIRVHINEDDKEESEIFNLKQLSNVAAIKPRNRMNKAISQPNKVIDTFCCKTAKESVKNESLQTQRLNT